MKQTIREVLEDMADGQINLASAAARETVSSLISAALKTKGTYTEYGDDEIEEQNARATWVCSICGENTADVDYDYIGSGTNHLGCEMKSWDETKAFGGDTGTDADFNIPAGEEVDGMYFDDEVEGWEAEVKKTDTLIDKSLEDFQTKLDAGELDKTFIYESPDGGKTIYRREFGSDERVKIKIEKMEK